MKSPAFARSICSRSSSVGGLAAIVASACQRVPACQYCLRPREVEVLCGPHQSGPELCFKLCALLGGCMREQRRPDRWSGPLDHRRRVTAHPGGLGMMPNTECTNCGLRSLIAAHVTGTTVTAGRQRSGSVHYQAPRIMPVVTSLPRFTLRGSSPGHRQGVPAGEVLMDIEDARTIDARLR